MKESNGEFKINPEILAIVRQLKIEFEKKGILIDGVFGSFVRGQETSKSDLDLLFTEMPEFREKYKGLSRLYQLNLIKADIEKRIGRKVDLVNKNALGSIAKKYILPEVIYV